MKALPQVSGRECVAALLKVGFLVNRQTGSHIILRRNEPFAQLVVRITSNSIEERSEHLFGKLN